jgi:hypothetical protein
MLASDDPTRPARRDGKREFICSQECIDSVSLSAPGRTHIGAWRKGAWFRKGRARKIKVKRASPGGLGGGYASVFSGFGGCGTCLK